MAMRGVGFEYHEERVTGLRVKDGTTLQADWYVVALPPGELTALLPERWLSRYSYFQHIVDLETALCALIHVRTAEWIANPRHILLGGGLFNWIACKPSQFHGGLIATLAMPQEQSLTDPIQRVSSLLRSLNLLQPDRQITGFRQEDRAQGWLSLPPGTRLRRPLQRSPVPNLLLAGAWTDTGWPANLESAIVSGERCAEIILHREDHRH
jgi:monoamine oxidase